MYILADIGGTNMRIAGSDDLKSFRDPIIVDTPQLYNVARDCIIDAVKNVAAGSAVDSISIGLPGTIAGEKRFTQRCRNLSDWNEKPLVNDLESALSTRVVLENDTALVGLGEAVYGAGKDALIVAYVTVSTGVNGVRIVGGRIDVSAQGFEIGGQYVSMDPPVALESLVSGRSIGEKYGIHPKELGIDSPVWEELAVVLGFAIHNSILHWSPHRIVIGGSMTNEIGINVDRVATHVRRIMKKFPTIPDIVHSSLGDRGGLWGGLAILKQKM